MDAVKVLPTACVEFGGDTFSETGWPAAEAAAELFEAAGAAPGVGGMACCFNCWTMADAALAAVTAGAALGAALNGDRSPRFASAWRSSMVVCVPVSMARVFRPVSTDSRTMCGIRTKTTSSCCTSLLTEPNKYLMRGMSDRPGGPLLVVLSERWPMMGSVTPEMVTEPA